MWNIHKKMKLAQGQLEPVVSPCNQLFKFICSHLVLKSNLSPQECPQNFIFVLLTNIIFCPYLKNLYAKEKRLEPLKPLLHVGGRTTWQRNGLMQTTKIQIVESGLTINSVYNRQICKIAFQKAENKNNFFPRVNFRCYSFLIVQFDVFYLFSKKKS